MVWRRKKRADIVFDEAARNEWLTGFKRRKDQRRKFAAIQMLEQERWDKIQAKKEQRESVKRQYKEIAYAEKKVEKLIGLQEKERKRRKALRGDGIWSEEEEDQEAIGVEEDLHPAFFLKDRTEKEEDGNEEAGDEVGPECTKKQKQAKENAAGDEEKGAKKKRKVKKQREKSASQSEDAESEGDHQDGRRKRKQKKKAKQRDESASQSDIDSEDDTQGVKTVNFAVEDDDPWGGCEVTTVEGALAGPGHVMETPLGWAVAIDGREEGRELTPAEEQARRQTRWDNLQKQEEIRFEALEAKIEKMKMMKMREKKKKKDPKKNKKKKMGKRDRRRLTKNQMRKNLKNRKSGT